MEKELKELLENEVLSIKRYKKQKQNFKKLMLLVSNTINQFL